MIWELMNCLYKIFWIFNIMELKILFIFVEGSDDEDFIQNIIIPFFESQNIKPKIIQYSKLSKKKLLEFLRTIKYLKNNDYIYLTDFDCLSHGAKNFCITTRKSKVINNSGAQINSEKIVVVKDEIESWYLAIANDSFLENYSIKINKDTETLYKEKFDELWEKSRFKNKKDFLQEILQNYSIENGIKRNKSFEYFINKFTPYSSPSSPQSF